MKVEITAFKIKVNKKTITLTLNEAKALFNELNVVFGPKYNYSWPYGGISGGLVLTNGTGLVNTAGGNPDLGSVSTSGMSSVFDFSKDSDTANITINPNGEK